MTARHRPRVYELYRAGFRLSCRTATYSYSTDAEILYVGAYSVRQAYHLAGHGTWGHPRSGYSSAVPVVHRGHATTAPRHTDRGSGTGNPCLGCNGRGRPGREGSSRL